MGEVVAGRPAVEVAAVVVHYGAVLLVKRQSVVSDGCWSVPSAPLQWGEHLQSCIESEVLLATGITVRSGASIRAYDRLPGGSGATAEGHAVVIEIEADYLGGELQRGATVMEAAWVSALAIPTMRVDEKSLELLADVGFVYAG